VSALAREGDSWFCGTGCSRLGARAHGIGLPCSVLRADRILPSNTLKRRAERGENVVRIESEHDERG